MSAGMEGILIGQNTERRLSRMYFSKTSTALRNFLLDNRMPTKEIAP
jgi:hypothetical protein